MVRIGIDARLNSYREGGIAEYTRRLVETLPTLDTTTDYHVFYHRRQRLKVAVTPAVRLHASFTPCHHRLERLAFGVEAARHRLDVLHSPDFIPPRFGARRFVITIHDLNFLLYPQFQTPDSLRYYAGQIRAAVRRADHILADSQATKADIVERLNVPPEKITVHLLGVDPIFRPHTADQVDPIRARLGLPSSYLLFVGTFEPRKNLPGLLNAYSLLRSRDAHTPMLVIAGRRGWLYEDVFQEAQRLNLNSAIRWLENVDFTDLPAVYNGAAVLTLPAFYEGFGFPPLEAMACGVPTVVSDRGSLPEVVGDTGLLINPDDPDMLADALHRALTDSAFRTRSRQAGIARAASFTWRRTAEIVRRVYQQVSES